MNLKEYLKLRGKRAIDIATRADLPPACVTKYLRGERSVTPSTAARISAATDGEVSIQELLYPNGLPTGARLSSDTSCRSAATQ